MKKRLYGRFLLGVTAVLLFGLSGCRKQSTAVVPEESQHTQEWIITEYGDPQGYQEMFYTIEDENKNLIIVDGGYDYDEQNVRDVIAEHGNHVAAWIITHTHPDHAGAYNAIAQNPEGIVVDHLYTVYVHYDRYLETAEDYDRVDVYETFLSLTKDLPELTYVKENDEWDIMGLHFKVLHAWDDDTDLLEENLCNNGSMMFTVSGNEETMLFCADTERESQLQIIDRHKEELNVDYVQLGHHGNWGLTAEFYDYMSPKAVFFDAPDWLMDTTDATYDAFVLKDYFDKKGIVTYTYATAPNIIYLH
jgi:beta-lactamase superfamily II metal-dependent hydrolase